MWRSGCELSHTETICLLHVHNAQMSSASTTLVAITLMSIMFIIVVAVFLINVIMTTTTKHHHHHEAAAAQYSKVCTCQFRGQTQKMYSWCHMRQGVADAPQKLPWLSIPSCSFISEVVSDIQTITHLIYRN